MMGMYRKGSSRTSDSSERIVGTQWTIASAACDLGGCNFLYARIVFVALNCQWTFDASAKPLILRPGGSARPHAYILSL
jgi:hypothetical protein